MSPALPIDGDNHWRCQNRVSFHLVLETKRQGVRDAEYESRSQSSTALRQIIDNPVELKSGKATAGSHIISTVPPPSHYHRPKYEPSFDSFLK